jgi:hypothetical protein
LDHFAKKAGGAEPDFASVDFEAAVLSLLRICCGAVRAPVVRVFIDG